MEALQPKFEGELNRDGFNIKLGPRTVLNASDDQVVTFDNSWSYVYRFLSFEKEDVFNTVGCNLSYSEIMDSIVQDWTLEECCEYLNENSCIEFKYERCSGVGYISSKNPVPNANTWLQLNCTGSTRIAYGNSVMSTIPGMNECKTFEEVCKLVCKRYPKEVAEMTMAEINEALGKTIKIVEDH